ncbi:diguanylate cyclase (GGDEF) domain-containing protein [Chromohalobacter canadensis]|uniref:diguanylate cyclase n=1 Tax=Chromohalobacter canadensis TaxID=141389 RepID=A0A285VT53_9GAMM|nr:GGDEF domain-containing protein [Chromohalobacter canadensis]SOC56758.1 diguanylate cyclase (GGDEF) domain-containing protein [Chromohalobacter canadensis]
MTSRALQRLWDWSCSAPGALPLEHRRSYEVVAQTFVFASLGHLLFACVLIGFQLPLLIVLNLACVATNAAALMLHRRLQLHWAMTVKLTATLLLITLSVWLIGPDAGFEYYFFLLLCEMLISDMAARYKIAMSATVGSVALVTLLMAPHSAPWMLEAEALREDVRLTNLVMAFLILGLILWRLHVITERCEHHFRRDATHDYLTTVLNRRAILHEADMLWHQQRQFTLLLLDADHFKQVNDAHGHTAGDEVLRHLAHIVRGTLREGDRLGRVGGEEFLIVFPDSTREEVLSVASRIRRCLADQPCRMEALTLSVTFSMGMATAQEVASLQALIDMADRRLYRAKSAGRDQLVMSDLEIIGSAAL